MDFRILGPLEVAVDGGVVPLGGGKQRALLAVLLLHANEVLSSDRLIDSLWGERPPDTAAKALQVHVSQLRKALGPDVLRTQPPGYVLTVRDGQLDLSRFERLLAEAGAEPDRARARELLGEALGLWRGQPLADVAYEPFAQSEIGRLEELRIAATEDRIDADLALGRDSALVGELESLIAAHPHRERPRAQLMRALYRAGRQAEALEAYRDARSALTGELGIEPSRELRELQEAILRQDPALDHVPPAPRAKAGPEVSETFVGRAAELGVLLGALEDARAGRGRVVLVAGEPGIGKSRLADELLEAARSRDARVLVGRCWEAGGAPPYWPWVQALREYVRHAAPGELREQLGTAPGEVAGLLPELRDALPDLPAPDAALSEGARFRLLEAVAAFLRAVAESRPLVVLLDDLHAADAESLLLLRFAAAQLAAPLLIVGCYRDTEVGADLDEALADLERRPAVQRVALAGLTEHDTARLLGLAMGRGPERELAERVQAGTQGNPLFATELGRLLATEGAVGDDLPIPAGVSDAIGRRLRRQSDECRAVLAVASVMGREFDPDPIARVSGLGEDALFEALDEAASARLIDAVPGGGGRLRFSHILVRDALYETLPAPRRMRLHRATAEALEAAFASNPDPHLAELAHHYLEAGSAVAPKALDYARRAGEVAVRQHGYEEAARHYGSALRVIETTGAGDAQTACELQLALGDALSRSGSARESRAVLRDAADAADAAGRPDLLAPIALVYGGRFGWARASSDPELVPLLERALAAAGEGPSRERAMLTARLAAALRDEPLRERRVRLADEALAMAEAIGDPATLAHVLAGARTATEAPHLVSEGLAAARRVIALGEQIGDREKTFAGHDHALHLVWQLADRAAVDVELDALERLADELRQPARRWHVGTGRTMLALMEGRFDDAERLIGETLALGERAESWNAVVSYRLELFVLRRAQGRLAELAEVIERSVAEYPSLLRFRCALAHLDAEIGRDDAARAVLADLLARDLEHEHLDAEWVLAMVLLADPCAALGERDGAALLYDLLLPHEQAYAVAPVEAAFGSAARALGGLAAALERYDDAERHFQTAIEIEGRMRARPWLAHAQQGLADMLLARAATGDAERAEALLAEAGAAYRELGMDAWAARAAAVT
ncbi:MAG: ATP-binding protein [Thermoleophilaceae bacterium]